MLTKKSLIILVPQGTKWANHMLLHCLYFLSPVLLLCNPRGFFIFHHIKCSSAHTKILLRQYFPHLVRNIETQKKRLALWKSMRRQNYSSSVQVKNWGHLLCWLTSTYFILINFILIQMNLLKNGNIQYNILREKEFQKQAHTVCSFYCIL